MIRVWNYIEGVVFTVLAHHCENYPSLQSTSKRAAGNLISRMREESILLVKEIVQMEKFVDYTCDPEYLSYWTRLMWRQDTFRKIVEGCLFDDNDVKITTMEIEGLVHLEKYKHLAQEAFDMKMRMISYWKIVLKRMVDSMALYLLFSIRMLVNNNLEFEIIEEMIGYGGGLERMLDESPLVAGKRERLMMSIKLLKESNAVLAKIMDMIAVIE